jgi:ankyrin repeat protein
MTALMIASSEGYAAAVQELLDRGADRSLKDREGRTARDHAATAGHEDIVKMLTATESRRSASVDRR